MLGTNTYKLTLIERVTEIVARFFIISPQKYGECVGKNNIKYHDAEASRKVATMSLEISKYLHHFDRFDMTEEQKLEYLLAVESVLQSFVDEAWGIEASQVILGTKRENDRGTGEHGLNLDQSTTSPFNKAAQ